MSDDLTTLICLGVMAAYFVVFTALALWAEGAGDEWRLT